MLLSLWTMSGGWPDITPTTPAAIDSMSDLAACSENLATTNLEFGCTLISSITRPRVGSRSDHSFVFRASISTEGTPLI